MQPTAHCKKAVLKPLLQLQPVIIAHESISQLIKNYMNTSYPIILPNTNPVGYLFSAL